MSAAVLYPDVISRQVAFAVELLDPVSGALVSTPATVSVDGLPIGPLNNLSGRFVFLAQPGTAGTVRVDLHGLPYEPISSPAPAPGQNLLRLTLQPTTLYPFDAFATVVNGILTDGGVAVAGAQIGVTFAAPQHRALPARTDQSGAFAVLLRLDPTVIANTDPVTADLTLGFTRNGTTRNRPGLRAVAGGKAVVDIASTAPVTQFDWAAL